MVGKVKARKPWRPTRLTDLKPEPAKPLKPASPKEQIECMHCDTKKPAEGARKFHSWMVCQECATKLETKTPKP